MDDHADSSTRVRVVHLGAYFDAADFASARSAVPTTPSSRTGGRAGSNVDRPVSAHSLKTLPRQRDGAAQVSRPSPLRRQGTSPDSLDETEHADDHDAGDDDARYATVNSYKTAREGRSSSVYGWSEEPSEAVSRQQRRHAPCTAAESTFRSQLRKALKELEDEAETFKIAPVGPIVAELDKVGS